MIKPVKFGKLMRLLSTFLIVILVVFNSKAQCPAGNLLFTTQAQVDNFLNQYPNCTQLSGEVFIGEFNANSDITNLQGFQNITTILGEVKIEFNDNLVDLSGLNNLTSVNGRLWIYSNTALTSFNGLQNLTTVGGNVVLENNISLTSLNGLNQLQTVGGNFQLRFSDLIGSLTGLDNLSSVGSFEVAFMDGLTSLAGIENLTDLGIYLNIRSVPFLTTFTPIVDNLTATTRLQITRCQALTNLNGLSALTAIGKLDLNFNDNLTSLDGLENLVQGSISIVGNPVLTDLNGLSNFTDVTNFTIVGNDILTSLAPLNNLITIQGDLQIAGNPLLTNLNGLNNLTTIGGSFDIGDEGFFVILSGNVIVGLLQYEDINFIDDLSALTNLTSIGADLRINSNQGLISLQGLNNLVSIGGQLFINNTNSLTSLNGLDALNILGSLELTGNSGLENIASLNTIQSTLSIEITNNDALSNLNGLNNIIDIDFNVIISENESLTNLVGLNQLNYIGGNLTVSNNPNLVSFDGINNLQELSSSLNITGNNILTSIGALSNIASLSGFLRIENNGQLNFCNYNFLCDYFENNVGAWFIIAGNGTDCTYSEIIESCDDSPLTLDCPSDVSLVLTAGANSIIATWQDPVGTTSCPQGGVSINHTGPTSGEALTVGTYTVSYEATDNCNNLAYCSIEIEILPTQVSCNVNVIVDEDVIIVTGLTGEENAKLFNENTFTFWECNPWDAGACTNNEVITGIPNGNYFLSVQSYNCEEWIPLTVTGADGVCTDLDDDGICADEDCNDFDPAIPGTPGASCNDYNSNTTNDVYSQDGCSCEGTPISGECNIGVQAFNNGVNGIIDISGLAINFNVKLFDQDYNVAWECNPWNGNTCTPTYSYTVTGGNDQFFLSIQSDDCNEWIPITVPGDLACTDVDNDGVCDEFDCAPNDNTLPADAGSPCDDGNDDTENDAIQADGCTCAGTPTGDTCNVSVNFTGPTQLTITGLSSTANTKLFDASVSSIVWECNPWDAGSCSNTEVVDLTDGGTQYFLSVQSDNCNEWIPLTVPAAINNSQQSLTSNLDEENQFAINNLFPNPGKDEIFIQMENNFDGAVNITFHDIVGKLSQQNEMAIEKGSQTFQLDVTTLNPGIYNITIQNALGQIAVERFIKI